MHENKFIRAFFALQLETTTRQEISKLLKQLKPALQDLSPRWFKPQNWHLTLQFLGNVELYNLDKVIAKANSGLATQTRFDLQLQAPSLFPDGKRPRILALETKNNTKLTQLVKTLGDSLGECGLQREKRPFRGHISLAKLSPSITPIILPAFTYTPINLQTKTICLYRSNITATTVDYEALATFNLPVIN